jgi:hypothetical protein
VAEEKWVTPLGAFKVYVGSRPRDCWNIKFRIRNVEGLGYDDPL